MEKKYGNCPHCNAPCEVIEKMDRQDFDGDIFEVPYDEYNYHPLTSPVWVKARTRLPGYETPVKWRDGNDHSHVTDGKIPLINMAKPFLTNWEWYDESPAEQSVTLTQERADFIREVNGRDLSGMKEQPVREVEAVVFGKWLKHLDNGTTHYNPFTKEETTSIGFSPSDCFADDTMTVEQLYNLFKKQKEK